MARSHLITDVFVAGAGPAGLAVAIAAAQRGLHVTVADSSSPAIDKPCGEGLLPGALEALEKLGVEFNYSEGRTFRGISFLDEETKVSAAFLEGNGLGVRRTVLHQKLASRAAQLGVRLLWNSPVSALDIHSVSVPGARIHAKWIIGADGHASRMQRWSGLHHLRTNHLRFARRRHYRVEPWSEFTEVHWANQAQAYVTAVSAHEVCVVILADTPDGTRFDHSLAYFAELERRIQNAEVIGSERGAVTAMRSLARVWRDNVALVGDASGGVDAITGEGLRLGFHQAFALVDAMCAGDLQRYQEFHRALRRRSVLMGRLLLGLARQPRIRGHLFRAMQRRPELFSRMLASHTGHGSSADLLTTGASLGWHALREAI